MKGNYIESHWNNVVVKTDFYVVKGIVENILDYLGFKNRYTFVAEPIADMHPGMSAKILLDRKPIGILGRVHPNISKEDIYVFELSMEALMIDIKPLKYKEISKYPSIHKDVAFIIDKQVNAQEIIEIIKKSAGRLLTNIEVFDVYIGDKIKENEKSIAYSLTFSDMNKTLTDEEINTLLDKIIHDVTTKANCKLRDF